MYKIKEKTQAKHIQPGNRETQHKVIWYTSETEDAHKQVYLLTPMEHVT